MLEIGSDGQGSLSVAGVLRPVGAAEQRRTYDASQELVEWVRQFWLDSLRADEDRSMT